MLHQGVMWLSPCSYTLSALDHPLSPKSFFHGQFLAYFFHRYPWQTAEEGLYSTLLLSETHKPAQITAFSVILLIVDAKNLSCSHPLLWRV